MTNDPSTLVDQLVLVAAQIRNAPCEFSPPDETISKTTANLEGTKNMKQIRVSFKMISAIALLALTVS
jgi:hypothetical protein